MKSERVKRVGVKVSLSTAAEFPEQPTLTIRERNSAVDFFPLPEPQVD